MRLNRFRVVPLLICLLAFAVRVWHLPFPQFSGDEGFTYLLASLSYSDLAHKIIEIGEPQPVGSFFLQKFWLDMGGNSEFNLRLLNVCFGVLAVAMMWQLMRELGNRPNRSGFLGALAAALILTFNPFGLDHSREYRTYAMTLAMSLACVLALLAYARRPYLLQALCIAGAGWMAIQAHYVSGFVLAALNIAVFIWHVLARRNLTVRRPPPLLKWLILQAVIVLLTLPWLLLVRSIPTTYPGTGRGQLSLSTVFFEEMALFTIGDMSSPFALAAVIAGSLALVIGLIKLLRSGPQARLMAVLMACGFALPLFTVWILTWVKPIFHPRYLIVIWPMAVALMCAPLSSLTLRQLTKSWTAILGLPTLGLVMLAFYGGVQYHQNLSYQYQWQALINDALARTADLPPKYVRIGINMPDPAFLYYYRKTVPNRDNSLALPLDRDSRARDVEAMDSFTQQRVRRVLVHVAPGSWWDVNNHAATIDPRGYTKVDTVQRKYDHFDVYERVFGDQLSSINVSFQNGVHLIGAEILTDSLHTALGVELQMTASQMTSSKDTKTFLHLIDPSAPTQVVAQVDLPLPSDLSTAHLYGMVLPKSLPQRTYELWVGLYDPAQPGAPRILTKDKQDRVLLGSFVMGDP